MNGKQRLELNWVGKTERPRLEPRILVEDKEKSYHAAAKSSGDIFDNVLVHGDNLLALKALESEFIGKVKCVYIDPPFNTQQALEHYDDGTEHSIWLSLMRDRLSIIRNLLTEDGTIFIHIDDNELGYLLVLCDEIFGRKNKCFVITFKQASTTGHKSINPGCVLTTNYILIYAKDKSKWRPNRLFTGRERDKRYGQFILSYEEGPNHWQLVPLAAGFAAMRGLSAKEARRVIKEEPEELNQFVLENAKRVVQLARPDYSAVGKETKALIDRSEGDPKTIFVQEREEHSDIYLVNGQRILFYSDKVRIIDGEEVAGEPLTTLWDDILSNNLHKEGGVEFPKGKKPEALLKRCLDLCSGPGDIVLDSFGGSGTTGAVAHKMKRRWIMVELGDQAETHIAPRLKSVIDGSDPNGVTDATGWKGGVVSAFISWRRHFLKKINGAIGLSQESTTPPCLRRRCAN